MNDSRGGDSGLTGLTTEQWQTLMDLLNGQKANCSDQMIGKCDTTAWIIDTGALNHIIRELNNIHDLHDIQNCPEGLPDGQHIVATKEGTIVLDEGLRLTNVLYVPKLHCNLISVSQLMGELDCVVQFTNKLCVMQDCTSRMLIDVGECRDGLDFFRGIRRARAYKTDGVSSVDLRRR